MPALFLQSDHQNRRGFCINNTLNLTAVSLGYYPPLTPSPQQRQPGVRNDQQVRMNAPANDDKKSKRLRKRYIAVETA